MRLSKVSAEALWGLLQIAYRAALPGKRKSEKGEEKNQDLSTRSILGRPPHWVRLMRWRLSTAIGSR